MGLWLIQEMLVAGRLLLAGEPCSVAEKVRFRLTVGEVLALAWVLTVIGSPVV